MRIDEYEYEYENEKEQEPGQEGRK